VTDLFDDKFFSADSLDWIDDDATSLETPRRLPDALTYSRRAAKIEALTAQKKQHIRAFFTRLPEPGECIHVISDGHFDYFLFIPIVITLLGGHVDEVYGSTWTMSRINVNELLAMYDAGKIGRIGVLTGTYFKRREAAVAAMLISGLQARGQQYRAFENHAKVILIKAGDTHIIIEGSANWTANPRLEQSMITNDAGLYTFHKRWMLDFLEGE